MRIVSSLSRGQHWTPDADESSMPVYRTSVVRPATPLTPHRIGKRLEVRARSVLGGLHHEYLLAPAWA